MPLRQAVTILRPLTKSPGYSISAVGIIALGIAASATVFSLVSNVFLKPLPVEEPEKLVRVFQSSHPDYLDYRERTRVFSPLAAHYSEAPLNITSENASLDTVGAVVSANYFQLLGLRPHIGRFFLPEEDQPAGSGPVAVLGFRFWMLQFSGASRVLGMVVKVNGTPFTIVGVAPEGFAGVNPGRTNDLWIPTSMLAVGYRWCDNAFSRSCDILDLLGRLRETESLSTARAEMSTLAAQLEAEYPGPERGRNALIEFARGLPSNNRGDDARLTRYLLALVACMLLIASANLGGLTLLRSQTRTRDVSLRLALGATRSRIIGQLMAESLVLSLLGGGLGILLSMWTSSWFGALYSRPNRILRFDLDPLVVACCVALIALVAIAFGLVPALRASQLDPADALQAGGRTQAVGNWRFRNGLVVVQVATCLVLTVAATLLAQSVQRLEPGMNFDTEGVAILRLRPRLLNYSVHGSHGLYRQVLERLNALPLVKAVSFGRGWQDTDYAGVRVALPGQDTVPFDRGKRAAANEVAPRYFETLSISLLAGRDFDARDDAGAPRVVVVNRTLALQLFGTINALGRTILVDEVPHTLIGVAENAEFASANAPAVPFVYRSTWQAVGDFTDARLSVRVNGDPAASIPAIRRAIREIDPNVPITEAGTLVGKLKQRFRPVYLAASVFGYVSVFAVTLCLVGLYTTLAFSVAVRRREIGIRAALGATRRRLLLGVVSNGVGLALAGVAIGSLGVIGASAWLANLLYGVSPRDITHLLVVASMLVAASAVAAWLPGLRAARIEPIVALRQD